MGSGVCPPKIKRAQKIDEKINEHAGTRNLSDSDFDGDGNGSDDSAASDDVAEVVSHSSEPMSCVHTAIAHCHDDSHPRHNPHGGIGVEVMSKLSQSLDPSVQQACEDACATHSLQNTQLLTMSQQPHDAQSTIESLCSQVVDLQA